MKRVRGWLALLLLLGGVTAAPAQFILPSPYAGGFGISIGKYGRHGHLSAYLAGGYGYYESPFFYPAGFNRVTVVQVYNPPTVVVAPPPIVADLDRPAPRLPPRPRAEEVEPPVEKPLPGEPAGGFRPVRAEDRARAREQVPPAAPPPKPPEAPKEKEKPKEKPPELPHPPFPEADPRAESARLSALGRAAFAAGQYGRAAQRFGQATRVNPNAADAYFLLAQAEVALGKYDEAVEAIQAGMRLEADWPTAKFRPVTLYDGNVADLPEHLWRLEDALTRHPDDAVLLFLYAYQLWFDGRQDEARPLFQRAAAVAPDKSFSERFLLARPDKPAI
jgi:hypothetical protein